jgi:phosphonate transport system substrate-binding protein
MLKTMAIGLMVGASVVALSLPTATAEPVSVWRIGILGGENEADRLKNYACWQEIVEAEMGVEVELYPASDYAGVMQGLISGNLESAELGSSGYAGIHLQDPDAVEPIVTYKQTDGSTGYYSVMAVRADSGITTLEEMKGKSLAFADPNSTSGYLVPNFYLNQTGFDTEGDSAFFGQVGFSGGHEQGIVAVLNGQYDAAVTWSSQVGDPAEGYSNGNLHKMVQKGALNMDDIRIIWQSPEIPNGPVVLRKAVDAEQKQQYKDLLMNLPQTNKECFFNISGGEAQEYVERDHSNWEGIIEMRRATMENRRG